MFIFFASEGWSFSDGKVSAWLCTVFFGITDVRRHSIEPQENRMSGPSDSQTMGMRASGEFKHVKQPPEEGSCRGLSLFMN